MEELYPLLDKCFAFGCLELNTKKKTSGVRVVHKVYIFNNVRNKNYPNVLITWEGVSIWFRMQS